ncbi:hypothetical protein EUGRSUZ_F00469 [Eucalyptus grandis]|uniref:Uncharacterized protein n=2 Tax=Eucalyptus grandis TaxID=71139 RepID=A0ACC3KBI1_EUCGR|nr:hypothetical protein EUGRSUZ_F00469 [Eucalyptus grandis]
MARSSCLRSRSQATLSSKVTEARSVLRIAKSSDLRLQRLDLVGLRLRGPKWHPWFVCTRRRNQATPPEVIRTLVRMLPGNVA